MSRIREDGLVQINAKITPQQKKALDLIREEKDFANFTEAIRYVLRKGIEAIVMD